MSAPEKDADVNLYISKATMTVRGHATMFAEVEVSTSDLREHMLRRAADVAYGLSTPQGGAYPQDFITNDKKPMVARYVQPGPHMDAVIVHLRPATEADSLYIELVKAINILLP